MTVTMGRVAKPGDEHLYPATGIPDWVSLSGISPMAGVVYALIKSHIDNAGRDDVPLYPTMQQMAFMLRLSRGDKVTRYLREVTAIGAIGMYRVGMPAHHEYVAHVDPPAGYIGPLTIDDWYDQNADELEARRELDGQRVAVRRDRMRATSSGPISFAGIIAVYGMNCHICREGIRHQIDLHFDHVVPLARGGRHVDSNILPSHAFCNLWKGVRLMSELAGIPVGGRVAP